MSFILEALRKSEHQRQREEGPGIAGLPVRPPPSRLPLALMVVGVLLAINVVILMFFLLRPATPPPAGDATAPAVEAPPAAAARPAPTAGAGPAAGTATIPPPQQPPREVRPLADEAMATIDSLPETDLVTNPAPPPAPDPSLLPAATASRPAGRVTAMPASQVPSIDTLPPADTAGLPELNLDLHIYASNPAQRAAFINGRRYREGDRLPEGVDVVSITTDGVELSYRGRRFLLPRQ